MPNPAFTFDTFLVSRASKQAFEAAVAVAEQRGPNPLFLCGRLGAGKTHLLHAIHHAVRARRPDAAILHLPAGALGHELVDATAGEELPTFNDVLARRDLILVDDFRLDDKHTNEAILRCLEEAARRSVQVVVASDAKLERPMIVLGYPDLRARRELARRAAARHELALPKEAVESIARRAPGSPRNLQNAIALLAAETRYSLSSTATSRTARSTST